MPVDIGYSRPDAVISATPLQYGAAWPTPGWTQCEGACNGSGKL